MFNFMLVVVGTLVIRESQTQVQSVVGSTLLGMGLSNAINALNKPEVRD